MTTYEFDEKNHTNEPILIAVKCVYFNASYKIKLILDGPYGRGEKPAFKVIENDQRLKGLDFKRYAVRFIYQNLGILPIGYTPTVHNKKEIDSLIYEHFNNGDFENKNNFTEIKALFNKATH